MIMVEQGKSHIEKTQNTITRQGRHMSWNPHDQDHKKTKEYTDKRFEKGME
jgi:hypothetical protein